MLGGIRGSSFFVAGSTCCRRPGAWIWRWTMPWKVLSPNPSWRARANAWSRLGPVTPFVPARDRTWQPPQSDTNSCLPLTTLSPRSVSPQPLRATATPITQAPSADPRTDLLSIGADPNRSGGESACQAPTGRLRGPGGLQVALGGGDDGPGHAVPGVALARRRDDRRAGRLAQLRRGGEPAREPVGELADGTGADLEGEPRARGFGDRGGQRLGGREHVDELGVVEPAREGHPIGEPGGRGAIGVRGPAFQAVEERGEPGQLPAVLPAGRAR